MMAEPLLADPRQQDQCGACSFTYGGLLRLGFAPDDVRTAMRDLGKDGQSWADVHQRLMPLHPRQAWLNAPQPLVSSSEAGLLWLRSEDVQSPGSAAAAAPRSAGPDMSSSAPLELSAHSAPMSSLLHDDPEDTRSAPTRRSIFSAVRRPRSALSPGRRSLVHQLHRITRGSLLQGRERTESGADESFMVDPFPRAHSAPLTSASAFADVAGASWVVPRGVAAKLLRCANAEKLATPQRAEHIARFVSQGKLNDPELLTVIASVEGSSREEPLPPVECPVCFTECPRPECHEMACEEKHVFCKDCLQAAIGTVMYPVCPGQGCKYKLTEHDIREVCGEGPRLERFKEAMLRGCMDDIPGLVRCPREGCENAVIQEGDERLSWTCDKCGPPAICTGCREPYHHLLECSELPQARVRHAEWCSSGRAALQGVEEDPEAKRMAAEARRGLMDLLQDERWKMENCRYCPFCSRVTHKTDGCDSMTCGRDAPDKGGGNMQKGCGNTFLWTHARPYQPRLTHDEQERAAKITQSDRVHRGKQCAVCSADPIPGVWLECVHCPPGENDVCGACDCAGRTTAQHDGSHVYIVHAEGDATMEEAHVELQREGEQRAQEHRAEYDAYERVMRRQQFYRRVKLLTAFLVMSVLVAMQVYAVFGKSLAKFPATLECSGPLAKAKCACWNASTAPTEAQLYNETTPGVKDYLRSPWGVSFLGGAILIGAAAAWWCVRAVNERVEYGDDDEDYHQYRNIALGVCCMFCVCLVFVMLGNSESWRERLLGRDRDALYTPAPTPGSPRVAPSVHDYFSRWFAILACIVLGLSCCMAAGSYMKESDLNLVCGLCIACCFIPALTIVCIGTTEEGRARVLGWDYNETDPDPPLYNVTNWILSDVSVKHYFRQGWMSLLTGFFGLSIGWMGVGAVVWAADDDVAAPAVFSGVCCVCVFLPCLVFMALGASQSVRNKLSPDSWHLAEVNASEPGVWTAGTDDTTCGLLSCDIRDATNDFVDGGRGDAGPLMRTAAAFGIITLFCEFSSVATLFSHFYVRWCYDSEVVLLLSIGLVVAHSVSGLIGWALTVSVLSLPRPLAAEAAPRDLCSDGWPMAEFTELGVAPLLMALVLCLWPPTFILAGTVLDAE